MKNIKALMVSVNYPNPYYSWAPWNKTANMAILGYVDMDVVAPLPILVPFKYFPYNELSQIPETEICEEGLVHRPRFFYPLPKKLFYGLMGFFYRRSVSDYILRKLTKPDLIHAHHVYPDGYGVMKLCEKWSAPLIVDLHSTDSLEKWLKYRGTEDKVKKTLNFADKIIYISRSIEPSLESLDLGTEKTEYIPLGVDTDKFKPRDRKKICRKLKVNEEKIIIFVGQLIKRKGLSYLLDALSKLSRSCKNFKVFIAGNGPEKRKLLDISKDLDLDGVVKFLGEVRGAELTELYSAGDIFVMPSLAEGRPMSIYEAMASECAVVATDIDGIPEQVKHGYNGLLFEPCNTSALAENLEYLIENEKIMEKMKKNSRKRVINEKWTWNEYSK
ncbi:MAG: glycosyltransferase family 4 protein, partial [Methanobacterium paludis]|nr:glycosyltransferase family 4 protein [Methanobacterium paludis]